MIRRTSISTREGEFAAAFTEKGLASLSFPSGKSKPAGGGEIPEEWKRQTERALEVVLDGRQPSELPPLDLSSGSAFQQKVWNALLAIPAGKTKSYSEVAASVGLPQAARAVGVACGHNPIPVLIPCHRVVAAHGLGGFSAPMKWKRLLLEREGVLPASLL
jgi:O-6-methylguanine DNA methyltransferase